jgi:hypothetical protein
MRAHAWAVCNAMIRDWARVGIMHKSARDLFWEVLGDAYVRFAEALFAPKKKRNAERESVCIADS